MGRTQVDTVIAQAASTLSAATGVSLGAEYIQVGHLERLTVHRDRLSKETSPAGNIQVKHLERTTVHRDRLSKETGPTGHIQVKHLIGHLFIETTCLKRRLLQGTYR